MHTKPTPPQDAVKRFLKRKEVHVTKKTLYNYTTALTRFQEYLSEQGIEDLQDVDSDEIARFEEWRLDDVKPITCRNDMRTVKNFIQFCESIQAVPVGLHELVNVTCVSEDDEICDDALTADEAHAILAYLDKYEYGSLRHVVLLLFWKCGMRIGGLRALDVGDLDESRNAIKIRHRPETGTPLKRKKKSERDVILSKETVDIVRDYLADHRPDVTDKYDRVPLVATKQGRASRTCITKHVYAATRPCYYNCGSCPFDKSVEECEATYYKESYRCPGSVSPHALRRGYVTAARNAGQPKDVTSERVNMSGRILEKHYDKGSHDEKAERRRGYIKDV